MSTVPDWAAATGDIWAKRWPDLDLALEGLSPQLLQAILVAAPSGPFRAFDVGCGAGTTTIAVANERPDASIIACDLSPRLVEIAQERTAGVDSIRVVQGDAEVVAIDKGPFDLIFSRHGVMFFPDPVRAFRSLRSAANPKCSLVFSCFHQWAANQWASEVASAAAARQLPSPGREPSGFAFSDPDYVREILASAGWVEEEARVAPFEYVAGISAGGVDAAISILSDVGPASAVLRSLPVEERDSAVGRMRQVVERHFDGSSVRFSATAWIWSAKAGSA